MTDLTPERLTELAALAEAASNCGGRAIFDKYVSPHDPCVRLYDATPGPVVAALVAEIQTLRAERERTFVSATLVGCDEHERHIGQLKRQAAIDTDALNRLKAERDAALVRAEAAERERDQYRQKWIRALPSSDD